ncbi:hypothetical protein Lal_00001718 [Lupinus albus]|uniref:Uncharacterized protein n=1 Tax=Lupinus albus TaxID=3870 RepID=A0A6A5P703_LUPAL|nr:hypothetical protein Lalb_Chr11g0061821 [Lupinus albus]KAF1893267.1 hypothetical protein Lal_00001718 [Lupinus albus]
MLISDRVAKNLTKIYVVVFVLIKSYDVFYKRRYSGCFITFLSTTFVGFILMVTLIWDVSRKAKYVFMRNDNDTQQICKGGICWHGVAEKSPASQLRFRLPNHIPIANDNDNANANAL